MICSGVILLLVFSISYFHQVEMISVIKIEWKGGVALLGVQDVNVLRCC
jgi:hypothetical protein